MRTSAALLLVAVMGLVVFSAVSIQGQEVEPAVDNSSQQTQDAYNTTEGVGNGVGTAMAPLLGLGAVVAFIVICLGLLVKSGVGGGR